MMRAIGKYLAGYGLALVADRMTGAIGMRLDALALRVGPAA